MAVSNRLLKVVYGTTETGIGSSFFIDASQRPIRIARMGTRFVLSFDVVITEADQATFTARCDALKLAFDPNTNPSLALLVCSDSKKYEFFDPTGGFKYAIVDYTLIGGKTFTVTVNGVATVLTEGVNFVAATSNAVTATNLATAIRAVAGAWAVALGAEVYVYSRSPATASMLIATNATGLQATAALGVGFGFNAVPSVVKSGSEDDTALSRRYAVEISLELPKSRAGQFSRRDGVVSITETDSKKRKTVFEGSYTALDYTKPSALEAYDTAIDAYCMAVLDALNGDWEGPFNDTLKLDDDYDPGPADSRRVGKIVRYSRTYQELIYRRSIGDDVRLRRQLLKVKFAIEAPGDYGPSHRAVSRLRRATVSYAAAVNKSAGGGQDLRAIWQSVVKPFLIDEAKLALGVSAIAVTFQEPVLDRAENRIEASVQVLGASKSNITESKVSTTDELDDGVQLVAVWDGLDGLTKQDYDGPKTLRRTVTQRYKILGGPAGSGKGAGGSLSPASGGFGIGRSSVVIIQQPSAKESAIDAFFGIGGGDSGGGSGEDLSRSGAGDEAGFATSGGVAERSDLTRFFRGGTITIEPEDLGEAGDPQLQTTIVTKVKSYEYARRPTLPSPTEKTPTLRDHGNDNGASNTPGMTVAKDSGPKKGGK